MKPKAEMEMLRHANKTQAKVIGDQQAALDKLLYSLSRVRQICRDNTELDCSKVLEIYCTVTAAMTVAGILTSGSRLP